MATLQHFPAASMTACTCAAGLAVAAWCSPNPPPHGLHAIEQVSKLTGPLFKSTSFSLKKQFYFVSLRFTHHLASQGIFFVRSLVPRGWRFQKVLGKPKALWRRWRTQRSLAPLSNFHMAMGQKYRVPKKTSGVKGNMTKTCGFQGWHLFDPWPYVLTSPLWKGSPPQHKQGTKKTKQTKVNHPTNHPKPWICLRSLEKKIPKRYLSKAKNKKSP